jgi:hypothetical protein
MHPHNICVWFHSLSNRSRLPLTDARKKQTPLLTKIKQDAIEVKPVQIKSEPHQSEDPEVDNLRVFFSCLFIEYRG